MRQAGTYAISYAIETAVPRLQRVIKKNIDPTQATRIISATSRQGILTTGFFMFGLPTETEQEVHQTIEFAARSSLNMACFSCYQPFPGTEGYRQLERQGYPVKSLDPSRAEIFKPSIPTNQIGVERLGRLVALANRRFMLNWRRFLRTFARLPRRRFAWVYFLGYLRRISMVIRQPSPLRRAAADTPTDMRGRTARSRRNRSLNAA
jgi:radical SAM superfamily enzyme YgiQ (UPF0313 family)